MDETATTGDTVLALRDGAARAARIKFGATSTFDVGISRSAAGQLSINDGSTTLTNYRDLLLRALVTTPVTVANLPSSPVDGMHAVVTDATATTFASIVAGGGSNHVPVYYDGGNSAWKIG